MGQGGMNGVKNHQEVGMHSMGGGGGGGGKLMTMEVERHTGNAGLPELGE